MKICPRCQKTYADDNLNFCLEDGSVLDNYGPAGAAPDTIAMSEPRPTQPQQAAPGQGGQPGWNVAPQPQQQPYPVPPRKRSSKTWIWVVLILGAVFLVCGGGLIGFIFWAANQDTRSNTLVTNANVSASPTSTSDRGNVSVIDLSTGWVQEFSIYGITEFRDGEFIMASRKKGHYIAVVAKEQYKTDDADTRVTVRNIDDAPSRFGYGLIFHSNPEPLQQDYAFLIDTKTKRYRIVRHEPRTEPLVMSWTASPAIKAGSAENVLEVRDRPDKVELYINGTMVTTIKNTHGYAGGVPGLYSGDGAKIAFKNFEIRK